jgi:hypothetical protein
VGWNQFDHLVVVCADSLIHWKAEWRAAVSYAIDQFASVLALSSATRLGCCTATIPAAFVHRWQARLEGVWADRAANGCEILDLELLLGELLDFSFPMASDHLMTMLRSSAEFSGRSEVDTL